jgi:hypothetical protein
MYFIATPIALAFAPQVPPFFSNCINYDAFEKRKGFYVLNIKYGMNIFL